MWRLLPIVTCFVNLCKVHVNIISQIYMIMFLQFIRYSYSRYVSPYLYFVWNLCVVLLFSDHELQVLKCNGFLCFCPLAFLTHCLHHEIWELKVLRVSWWHTSHTMWHSLDLSEWNQDSTFNHEGHICVGGIEWWEKKKKAPQFHSKPNLLRICSKQDF